MSYAKESIYEIVPTGSWPVIRNCSGCRKKTTYINTNCFRVNAGGSRIDIWLIYQCSICKHTLNLTIYERKPAGQIPQSEYQKFMANDRELAEAYGRDKSFFVSNRVETDNGGMKYQLKLIQGDNKPGASGCITIRNLFQLKIRSDKLLTELFGISRTREKELEAAGYIIIDADNKTGNRIANKTELRVTYNFLDLK